MPNLTTREVGEIINASREADEGPSALVQRIANVLQRRTLVELLTDLTDEQRVDVFAYFCTHCGSKNPNCQCWNDE